MRRTTARRTEVRRYHQPPAAWLWAAMLAVPAALTVPAWLADEGPADAAQVTTTTTTQTQATSAPRPEAIDLRADPSTIIVDAVVADEASRTRLLDQVRAGAGGREILDQVTVIPGRPVTDPAGLGDLVRAAAGEYRTFGVHLTPEEALVTGTAERESALAPLKKAAADAFPGRSVKTVLAADAPTDGSALSCAGIEAQIETRLAKDPIMFASESARIDRASSARLTEVGKALASCGSSGIKVNGHTDSTGTERLNRRLGQDRAEAVRDVLVRAGVQADDVVARGFAARRNVAPNDTPASRQKNRRVVIIVGSEGR